MKVTVYSLLLLVIAYTITTDMIYVDLIVKTTFHYSKSTLNDSNDYQLNLIVINLDFYLFTTHQIS